ncbi:hypothetical protein ID853_02105 [Xenorhabdus sp. Vera]|uniref:hypothetical protein n=1 Tax=Xenorhabdus koppenhoeferi TaxID=351659 RepID=UPI0019B9665A|nr:hypothetical protein [Xenorhabdus sp. Vera]MBD2809708.1 hypothetical protein [Xenorhabdus sp. Vera]
MLKRTNSFDGYINKTSTDSISRSKSFDTLPPDNLLNINININNPRLINGYIPVVRETNKQETINKVNNIHNTIIRHGWFSHIEDINNQNKTIQKIRDKKLLWDMRCHTTNRMLLKVKEKLSEPILKYDETYAYFILYIDITPIGVMLFKGYTDESIVYPEVEFLITHPGVQNCAYLLMEKAVNKSYQIGCSGNLKLSIAEEELYGNVYSRMGFTRWTCNELILVPSRSNAWFFSPNHGGYRFKGTC